MRKSLILLLCIPLLGMAQRKKNSLFSIRGSIGIPRSISSRMFAYAFKATYEANISANLRLFSNAYIGVGYQNTFFRSSTDMRQKFYFGLPFDTGLQGNAGYVKLGYDQFFKDNPEKGYFSYSLNAGMMYLHYSDVVNDTNIQNQPYVSQKFTAPYIQPEVSVNFIVEKRLAFSLILSYTTLLTQFDPKAPRFNAVSNVSERSNNYYMSWFTFGFGAHVLIGK